METKKREGEGGGEGILINFFDNTHLSFFINRNTPLHSMF